MAGRSKHFDEFLSFVECGHFLTSGTAHHHTASTTVGLVTCSVQLIVSKSFDVVVLGFVSHTVDISQYSAVICPFAEHVVSIYFCNFEFSLQLG